jgi:hypothetical protein
MCKALDKNTNAIGGTYVVIPNKCRLHIKRGHEIRPED